eukprot:TRINITY_DN2869_c0_g1_i1.p1 TRINITY_DN2869_c0_g1~~TRINITY_DN2869_c0_g1_i1.p1  ORF type:complete len:179 (+),score=56.32 TRINITY_DN2869_c0_g1_i1:42-539(+)
MNEINAAERQKVAATNYADAEKIKVIKNAEADAESKYLAGVGVARQRMAIVDGLRDSVVHFSEAIEGSTSKDVMDLVLITQYFDTMKDIGAHSKGATVFVEHSPASVSEIAEQVRKGFLQTGNGRKLQMKRKPVPAPSKGKAKVDSSDDDVQSDSSEESLIKKGK